jgi:hypothetical protein
MADPRVCYRGNVAWLLGQGHASCAIDAGCGHANGAQRGAVARPLPAMLLPSTATLVYANNLTHVLFSPAAVGARGFLNCGANSEFWGRRGIVVFALQLLSDPTHHGGDVGCPVSGAME